MSGFISALGRIAPVRAWARGANGWTGWLLAPAEKVSPAIQVRLDESLFFGPATVKIAAANAALVSATIAIHFGSLVFALAAAAQMLLAAFRVIVHHRGCSKVAAGAPPPVRLYALASTAWSLSLGVESALCVATGDWVAATLVAVSGAAMAGGMCLRNFSAPRLAAAMILASLGPLALAALGSGETVMLIAGLQLPLYMFGMTKACFYQNRLWIRTMQAELLNDHHAHHDSSTGTLNREGLIRWLKQRELAGDGGDPFAFFLVEVEGLGEINHTLGHAAGQHVARLLTKRLQEAAPGKLLARLGDGEFILIGEAQAVPVLAAAGEQLVSAISGNSYRIGGDAAFLTARAGVALAPEDGSTFNSLLDAADASLQERLSSAPVSVPPGPLVHA
jgi:diguanylate cyclase (GGDEF)-like protein